MQNKYVKSAALTAGLLLVGCVNNDGSPSYQTDTLDLTANFTDNVLLPQYRDFSTQSAALVSSLNTYCAAIGTASESAENQQATAQWRDTMASWQQAEAYLVGPVAANSNNIRNRINVFADSAVINSCRIDRTTLEVADDAASVDISALSNNQRGLGGIEYLLFNNSTEFTCSGDVPAAWTELTTDELTTARCQQAQKIASHITGLADDLITAWEPEQDNYRSTFINPSVGGTQTKALSDSLFYLDANVKDSKLRLPLGIRSDSGTNCGVNACPDAVEYGYSEASLLAVRNNLVGFKAVFTGNGGYSFDDIMIEQGHKDVADLYVQLVDEAIALIDLPQDALKEQATVLVNEPLGSCSNLAASSATVTELKACLLYGKVKSLTDELKTSFVAIVDLDIPDRVQSDND
ncbi:Iron-regulated protein A [BD1-7 clade bacterium]|uniref:Iron-regulated protein A n=1 Tax=BD1-7 clade bacterium TaxID=2029982 RepID=A0A5S9QX33_9GAMM|nr:Iron-regulated protein A [BD1-7 clade bacterium]